MKNLSDHHLKFLEDIYWGLLGEDGKPIIDIDFDEYIEIFDKLRIGIKIVLGRITL